MLYLDLRQVAICVKDAIAVKGKKESKIQLLHLQSHPNHNPKGIAYIHRHDT